MRATVKALLLIICGIPMLPLVLLSRLGTNLLRTDVLFGFITQWISLIPNPIGIWSRGVFYALTLKQFPFTGIVGFGSVFVDPRSVAGPNCYVADYAIVGLCRLGRNVIVGSRDSLIAGRYQHNFTDPTKGVFDTEPVFECLEIGDDVFLGEGVICMANVGEKSIVGAGSVVVRDIPPYSVAVGNPARVVKTRRPDGPWESVPRKNG